VQTFQLFYLLLNSKVFLEVLLFLAQINSDLKKTILIYLKDSDLVHEIHDFVSGVVEAGGSKKRRDMKWHMGLGCVENKELGPTMFQHVHLNEILEE